MFVLVVLWHPESGVVRRPAAYGAGWRPVNIYPFILLVLSVDRCWIESSYIVKREPKVYNDVW